MTVVAGVARDGVVYMAADTATVHSSLVVYGKQKIRQVQVPPDGPRLLVGYAGDGGLIDIAGRTLASMTAAELRELDDDPDEQAQHIAHRIAHAVDELGRLAPVRVYEDGSVTGLDGTGLLGIRGRLYYLATHQAVPVADGIGAIGSGELMAIGALHALLDTDEVNEYVPPAEAIRRAVDICCQFTVECRLPFGRAPEIWQAS